MARAYNLAYKAVTARLVEDVVFWMHGDDEPPSNEIMVQRRRYYLICGDEAYYLPAVIGLSASVYSREHKFVYVKI